MSDEVVLSVEDAEALREGMERGKRLQRPLKKEKILLKEAIVMSKEGNLNKCEDSIGEKCQSVERDAV